MTNHKLGALPCPKCGHLLDLAKKLTLNIAKAEPSPGVFTICNACASILRLQDDMSLRLCTAEDLENEDPDDVQQLFRAQKNIRKRAYLGFLVKALGITTDDDDKQIEDREYYQVIIDMDKKKLIAKKI